MLDSRLPDESARSWIWPRPLQQLERVKATSVVFSCGAGAGALVVWASNLSLVLRILGAINARCHQQTQSGRNEIRGIISKQCLLDISVRYNQQTLEEKFCSPGSLKICRVAW